MNSDPANRSDGRSRGGISLLNVLTVMLVGATLISCVIGSVFLLLPGARESLAFSFGPSTREPVATPTLIRLAQLPTALPATATPATSDLAPTWTPPPPATRPPLEPTNTRRPTLTPSITPTFPPPTPTRTPTSTPTSTSTPGPSPTVTNTRSPFPFTSSPDSPIYLQNYANAAGCDWLGIAGEVLDVNGNPVPAGSYRVHVWGDGGIDERRATGTAPAYSPSGWEQFIFNAPAIRNYNLQLETSNGTAVSQVYQVQTRASCNQNLLYFIFIQNR